MGKIWGQAKHAAKRVLEKRAARRVLEKRAEDRTGCAGRAGRAVRRAQEQRAQEACAQKQPRPDLSAESGQALIELALTLVLIFGFFLFFVQLSLVLSFGNYVQYVTFMAARAYLSGGTNPQDQEERARSVMMNTVKMGSLGSADRFPMIARGEGGGDPAGVEIGPSQIFDADDRSLSWMQGVRYTFRSRLFLLPLSTRGPAPGARSSGGLVLTSEAWLGRETTYSECLQSMSAKGRIDNGC